MSKSIMQGDTKECWFCRTTQNLERHHIYMGPYRKWSEAYGCWVWLCRHHHTGDIHGSKDAVHHNAVKSLALMQACQRKFEETHTRKEFMRIFGRNWL